MNFNDGYMRCLYVDNVYKGEILTMSGEAKFDHIDIKSSQDSKVVGSVSVRYEWVLVMGNSDIYKFTIPSPGIKLVTMVREDAPMLIKIKIDLHPDFGYDGLTYYSAENVESGPINPSAGLSIPQPTIGRLPEVSKLPGVFEAVRNPDNGRIERLEYVIIHLNDTAKWSRERIADWLETLDIDLRFK